jgi:hypothetical protein
LVQVFAGRYVGVTEVADDIWLVSFMDYDLGFFDKEVNRIEPVGENFFSPKVFPMSPEQTVMKWYAWQGSNLRPSVPESDSYSVKKRAKTG